MFRTRILALAVVMGGLVATSSAITITVLPSLAPNGWGSPSFAAYCDNAVYAIENGLSTYGTGPAGYSQVTGPVDRASVIVTGFPSWLGKADPGTVYGAEYAGELGNRMTFGLHILGEGTQFSISQLNFRGSSTGDSNGLGIGFEYLGSYVYNASYVGINYGADRTRGTADDLYITSGPSSQLIDELVGRGSGNSYPAYRDGVHTDQELIDMAASDSAAQWNVFTGTYWLTGAGGDEIARGAASFQAVPEPFTMALCAGGLLLALKRRRRR